MATTRANTRNASIGSVGRDAQALAHAINKGGYGIPGVRPSAVNDRLTEIEDWESLYSPQDRRSPLNRSRRPPREQTDTIEAPRHSRSDGDLTGPYYPHDRPWPLPEKPATPAKETSLAEQVLARYDSATVFINGMNTSLADHRKQAQTLADARKSFVVGIYNASSNPTLGKASETTLHPGDVPQAIKDSQGYVRHNPATATLARIIARYGDARRSDGGLRLYGHSQGSMIAVAALREAKVKSGTDISRIDVKLVGTMVRTGPRGPRYDVSINVSDWVALGSRLGLELVVDPLAAAAGLSKGGSPETDQSLLPFTVIRMRPGGHDLIKGYLPDETDTPSMPRPMAGPMRVLLNALVLHGGWIPIDVAQRLAPHVRAIVDWVRRTGGQAWQWINPRVRALVQQVVVGMHQAVQNARTIAGQAWRRAQALARRAWQTARTLASRAVRRARAMARTALQRARSIARRVRLRAEALVRRAWDAARQRITRAAQAASRAARSAWNWARQTASRLWEWGNRRAGGALEWVADRVQAAWFRARSIASEAARRARAVREATLRFARHRARQVWDWASDRAASAYEWMRERAGRAWDLAQNVGASAWDRARRIGSTVWRGAWALTRRVYDAARRRAAAWMDRFRRVGRFVWDLGRAGATGLFGLIGRAVDRTSSWGRDILDRLRAAARTVTRPLGRFARRAAGRARDFVTRHGSRAWRWLRSAAGRAWDYARSLAGRAAQRFRRVTRPLGLAWRWGRRVLGSAYRWVSSRARRALQRGASLARRLAGLGRAMAGAAGRGIRRAFGWIRSMAERAVRPGLTLGRLAARWAARMGGSALRGVRRTWRRFRRVMRRPLRAIGRGVRSLGVFMRRTLGRAIRRITRGLGVLSSRGGAFLGRLLRAATRGAGLLGRTAGTLLARIVRRALSAPGTAASWAGSLLGRLLRSALGAARTLDRATGGLLTGLAGRLARGAGAAGAILGGVLSRLASAVVGGGSRLGQFVGGLVGRMLGGALTGAERMRDLMGSALGRLLGAGLRGLRRADSLTGGLLGRALGAGARGARRVGRLVGGLAGRLLGGATQAAQLVGGMAQSVVGRLLGYASRGTGVVGRALGSAIGRIAARARERFGVVRGGLGTVAARALGVLARGVGLARSVGGQLLGRALGRGMRAVGRLGSFIGRGLREATRTYRRILVAQRPLVSPIGDALARIGGRLGRLVGGTAGRVGRVARSALRSVGRLARAAGGMVARVARRTGDFVGRTARPVGRFLGSVAGRVLGQVSRPFRFAGDLARVVARRVGEVSWRVAEPIGRTVRRAGRLAGDAARRVGRQVVGTLSRIGGTLTGSRPVARAVAGPLVAGPIGTLAGRASSALAAVIPARMTPGSTVGAVARQTVSTARSVVSALGRGLGLFRDAVPGASGTPDGIDPALFRRRLIASGGTGAPLDMGMLTTMRHSLGHDFSNVRVHRDPTTARAASAINAQAFTIGSDVFFGANRYDPHSPAGQSLIAHELTHVVQQSTGRTKGIKEFSRQGGDTLEQEAQLAAKHVLARVGRPNGLVVDDYARTYETEDDSDLATSDQKRLDTISLMALNLAEHALDRRGYRRDVTIPVLDVDLSLDLGEMSDQQAAQAWADAIVAQVLAEQDQARIEMPAQAPRIMRAPKQEPERQRLTITEEAKASIRKDVEAITANVRSWWRKPSEMVAPMRRWYEEDVRLFGGQGTPHLDWLIFLMHQRLFDKGTVITRFTSTLDEVERYLADRPEGAAFKLYKGFSQRWKSYQPAKEMESALSYVGKRELYAGWMIIKGLGTALTGLADVGVWAFWKTSGWPLRKVLEKFGIKADKLYLTPYIDKKFDETADILQKELGIDANEKLFGSVSLKTFSEGGGKVVGGLMTAGALGQVAKAGQAAQVAGNLDKARKIQLGLQAVNVTQGLQQGEQLADRIKQLREGPPPQSWSDIVKRPDVWSQVVGIMGTAVGAKMSWSQAQGMVSKTAQRLGLALNATQTGLLAGAYGAVEDDPTLSAEEKQKARAEILSQIVTSGALMADSVWGAKYEAWKQRRAEERHQQLAAERKKQLESGQPQKALLEPDTKAKQAAIAEPHARPEDVPEPAQKSRVKPKAKAAEERAAKEKPPARAAREGLDELKQMGDWDEMLKRHGAGSKTAKQAHAAREQIIKDITKEYGASATGTAGPASDVDVTFPTERALHAAKRQMEQRYGPHWEKLFKASFNSDVTRAHAHLDPRLNLTPEQKASIEARLSKTSERMILERLKAAGAHSDTAKAAFKEEAARLGVHKREVEIPRLTKAQVRAMELQQDAAVANYEKTLKTLEAARARANTPPDQLAALQDKAIRQSVAITERQMRINQAYPDRYMTPGGVKGAVSGELLSKFDRTAYAQKVMEQLAKQQDPKSPTDPKALWQEAYRRARLEEARTRQWRESFKELTPQEAYQRALMERLELVEQMAKAESEVRQERGSGARVSREEVLQRVFERYEFSKYAARAMETAQKLGIGGFDDLASVAKGIYKPSKTVGGTEARGAQVEKEASRKMYYLDDRGRPVLQSKPDIRMTVYAGLLDRVQKQIIARLHEIVQGQMDIPDLPYQQTHPGQQAKQ